MQNVEYPLGTLQRLLTDTAHACHKLCQAEASCYYFTFKSDLNECTLKDATAPSKVTQRNATVSGPKYCDGTTPPGPNPNPGSPVPPCAEKNTEYFNGEILSVLAAESAVECQTLCKLTASCNYFTYRADLYRCYLNKKKGTPTARANTFSGPKECTPEELPPHVHTCFQDNIKIIALPLETVPATSAVNCQELCAADPNCDNFTFQKETRDCFLHGQVAETREDRNSVSGPKKCPGVENCSRDGLYIGQVLKRTNSVVTVKECKQMCSRLPHACLAFTYEKATQKCFLLSQVDSFKPSAAFVSGMRNCNP